MRGFKYILFILALITSVSVKGQYNPTNPAEPGVYYTLTLGMTPSGAGSFNINTVTSYSEGTNVSLRAYTNTNFAFVAWEEDGEVISTSSSFTYKMPAKNTKLIAHYKYSPSNPAEPTEPDIPVYSTLTLGANPSSAGYFNISSGNKYEVGSSVSLRAYTNSNFSFVNWTENGEVISTSSQFTYVMKAGNPKLIANYKYNPSSPGEPSEPQLYHKLYLNCNPSGGGYFNVSSGNEYQENSSVSLRAYSNQYYTFVNWTIGDSVISNNYSFSYIMPKHDVTLTANYTYNYNPSNPNEPNKPTLTEVNLYGMTENGVRGQTITFPIFLENNQSVNGVVLDVQFPERFVAHTSEVNLAGRASGHELDVRDLGDNNFRFFIQGENAFESDNGKLFEIPVSIPDTARMGYNYPVILTHGVMLGADNSQTPISVRNGYIYVEKISEDGLYAKYSYDKLQGRVKFTNQSSGKAVSYLWDFGDGTTSTEKDPLHVYAKSGYYSVKLTAKGEVDEDVAESTVLINDESSWKVDGTFYLSDELKGVRYFTTTESLFDFISARPIAGNIKVAVKSEGEYTYSLSSSNVGKLRTIQSSLAEKSLTLSFIKDGNGRNSILNFGEKSQTVDPEVVQLFISLGANLNCDGVETQLWGTSFDAAKISSIKDQTIHSGEKTSEVDFSTISPDLVFTWTLAEEFAGVSGYEKTGTRTIPSMTIVNEAEGNRTLVYNIIGAREGQKFCEFTNSITVTPALVGIFSSLTPVDGTISESTSISLSWNSITNAVYDVYLWNANNQRPQTPVVAGTTNLRYQSTGFCQNGNTYKWQVVARNEGQTLASDTMSFCIRALPNLHVYAVDCSAAMAGEKFTVQWTVKNDGVGSTGETQWNDYIWLVTDVYAGTVSGNSSNNATLLATVPNVKALESGESYENKIDITLGERVYGNYYIIVAADMYSITDIRWGAIGGSVVNPYNPSQDGSSYKHLFATTTASYNKVYEQGEQPTLSDNFFYKKIEVAVQPLADIQVPEITSFVIPTVDPVLAAAAPARNAGYTSGGNYEAPLITWEECYVPTPITAAGLRHSNAFYSGKKIAVKVKVANKGAQDTEKPFKTVLYISHSEDKDNGQLYAIGSESYSQNIPAGGEATLTFTYYLPYDWYGDTYFYAYADIDDKVYELANTQNNWGKSDKYDILLCPGADFEPSNISIPASVASSDEFNVSYKVTNRGSGIPYNNGWKDKIYISTNKDALDDKATLLKTVANGGYFQGPTLPASAGGGMVIIEPERFTYQGDNYSQNITVKPSQLAEGTYYVYVKVDSENQIFEHDGEENNILRSEPIQVKFVEPDLSVELISISADSLSTGDEVAVTWKLKNNGTGDIKDVKITDAFYATVNMDGTGGTQFATVENNVWIAAGSEKTLRANIKVPSNSGLNGVRYIYAKTNVNGSVKELSSSNNTSSVIKSWFTYVTTPSTPTEPVKKGANLTVRDLSMQSSVKPGATATVTFVVKNNGDEDLADIEVAKEVYVSTDYQSSVSNLTKCEVTSSTGSVAKLKAGESRSLQLKFTVPENWKGGRKYVYVYLDRTNQLGEKSTDDNRSYTTFTLEGNLPDLSITECQLPDTIMTSQNVTLKFKVANNGEWDASKSTTLVYLSSNSNSTYNATQLASLSTPTITKGGDVEQTATFSVADKKAGKWYILINADAYSNNSELNENNNMKAIPVTVLQSPLPDLLVESVSTDEIITTGQPVKITTTVANKGKSVTRSNKWTETYYLSSSTVLNTNSAIQLGSKSHVGTLDVDASYTSEATFNIPTNVQGNYMLFVVTDATDAICEDNENNNSLRIPVYVNGAVDTPADIVIKNVDAPSSFKAGEDVTISYQLSNEGEYTASGTLHDVIYLSKDNKWDKDDEMVGVATGKVTINPGNTITRSVTGRITNMPEGNYYVIVKTNSTKTIAEKSDENNTGVMSTSSRLSFNTITLGSMASLTNSGYYKLEVSSGSEGKTVGFYLDHPDEANVGLYAAYESVPSTARSDFQSTALLENQQEVLIPNVKAGNYYILAQDNASMINSTGNVFSVDGSGSERGNTPLSLSAKEIQFGATTLSITEGGNGGWVSTDINGALFDSIMDFRLKMDKEVIPAEMVAYNGMTKTRVTFNLNKAETGSYDVVSELPDGTQATLPNGFRVIPGTNVNLGIKLDVPSVVRVGNYAPFSISYANGGNTNIEIYGLVVALDNGYIATTIKGLDKHESSIELDLDTEGDSRGYMSIPPGTQKTINLFMYQTVNLSNMNVYIVK